MDYRNQGDQGMGNPCPNPIRVSSALISKPNSSPSPKDHHAPIRNGSSAHDHHHHPPAAAPDPVQLGAVGAAATATATTSGSTAPKSSAINYRECLRNHAAAIGGHVLDGCCEFMPGDADPLKCAACDCHRSFHRKQAIGGGLDSYYHRRDRISVPLLLPPPHPLTHVTSQNYGGGHHKQQLGGAFPASPSGVVPGSSAVVAFGGGNNSGSGATTGSSSEERLDHAGGPPPVMESKKRVRTKFTAEQKEKMMGFAERVGWRIQRQNDATVEQLCREVGVRRQVLKVWMHNNKHSIKKQQLQQQQNIESQQQQQQPMVVMRGEI